MAPKAWRKMKARGGRAADLWQRFGFFDDGAKARLQALRDGSSQVWWIHAVSVGEVGIAVKLMRELRARDARLGLVVTTTTPTGLGQLRNFAEKCGGQVLPLYSALDGWTTVRRFLNAIRPAQLVLVEAEVWPNLVHACHGRGIPVSLVNARLSPRSERRFRKFRFLVRPIYALLSHVGVQEPGDPERFASALGLRPETIRHTGSVKFDTAGEKEPVGQVQAFRTLLADAGLDPQRPVLMAISTHPGEERALGEVYQKLRAAVPGLYYVVVPRHAERGAEVMRDLHSLGLQVRLRSTLGATDVPAAGPGDALVVDSTGELRAWQHLAAVVVIGKSFLGVGGQNPAEAVVAGRPVVFGPHMENFSALRNLLVEHGGAVEVPDVTGVEAAVADLLRNPERASHLTLAAHQALKPHHGATARTVDMLLPGVEK